MSTMVNSVVLLCVLLYQLTQAYTTQQHNGSVGASKVDSPVMINLSTQLQANDSVIRYRVKREDKEHEGSTEEHEGSTEANDSKEEEHHTPDYDNGETTTRKHFSRMMKIGLGVAGLVICIILVVICCNCFGKSTGGAAKPKASRKIASRKSCKGKSRTGSRPGSRAGSRGGRSRSRH